MDILTPRSELWIILVYDFHPKLQFREYFHKEHGSCRPTVCEFTQASVRWKYQNVKRWHINFSTWKLETARAFLYCRNPCDRWRLDKDIAFVCAILLTQKESLTSLKWLGPKRWDDSLLAVIVKKWWEYWIFSQKIPSGKKICFAKPLDQFKIFTLL